MSRKQTKSSALDTTLGFIYQTLIALERCFDMKDNQTIWIERDGDVSIVAASKEESSQIEVKKYAETLTDNHENFWKTLKNWLSDDFEHGKYSSLILLTTQKFGSRSTLNSWNNKSSDERLKIVRAIFSKRTPEELSATPLKPIVLIQKAVCDSEQEKLKSILEKVTLTTDADNLVEIKASIKRRYLGGIPTANQDAYIQGLIGFIYDSASAKSGWEIPHSQFKEKQLALTSVYHRKGITFPPISDRVATDEERNDYIEKGFVQKIQDIDYDEVIPEAIGNWLELHNSLNLELDGYPQYAEQTVVYQKELISKFKRKYSQKCRYISDPINDSKDLYDETIGESPSGMPSTSDIPPLAYKNGLIHDAMNERDIKWKVEK